MIRGAVFGELLVIFLSLIVLLGIPPKLPKASRLCSLVGKDPSYETVLKESDAFPYLRAKLSVEVVSSQKRVKRSGTKMRYPGLAYSRPLLVILYLV